MKTKITLMSLLIVFLLTTNTYASEVDRSAMHTDDANEQLLITDGFGLQQFDDALYRDMVFFKTLQPETYEVQEGDNLFRIALNNEVELEDLMEWNNLKDYTIHPGEELILFDDVQEETTIADISSDQAVQKEEKKTVAKNEQQQHSESSQPKIALTSNEEPSSGKELMVTATAYTAYCEGCSGTTAIGIDLRSNPNQRVIAVDPKVIPLGSKVWVEGYGEAIAGDTGGAIKGNKIDVFIPSHDQALQWGRKKVKIKILN